MRASNFLKKLAVDFSCDAERSEAGAKTTTGGTHSCEPGTTVLKVEGLSKKYDSLQVLTQVSFQVYRGEIFGLLGQNGAGKTTILEMIEGLRDADRGSITVFGLKLKGNLRQIRARLGVSLQTSEFWGQLKVREVIDLFRSFYRKPLPRPLLLSITVLTEIESALLKTLSGGQRQRVNLCLALVNDPDLIMLDEPTVGLDPEARRALWGVINRLRSEQKTIVLTTHYLEEAQELCDRVAILHKGSIVRCESPASLVAKENTQAVITARLSAQQDGQLQTILRQTPDHIEVQDGILTTRTYDVRDTVHRLYRWADESGLLLERIASLAVTGDEVGSLLARVGRPFSVLPPSQIPITSIRRPKRESQIGTPGSFST